MKYSPPRYLLRRHTVLKKVKKVPSGKFIEVGAGNLMLSTELISYFKTGVAVDFAPRVKDIYTGLPDQVQAKLSVRIGDIFKLKLGSSYDCVVSCEVMEHIEDDSHFLDLIHSLASPNGQVVISVPARKKYWTIHDEMVGHFKRYEKQELIDLFKQKGFKSIEVISYGFPFINIFWFIRKLHGVYLSKQRASWSKEKQTKESGTGQLPNFTKALGFICNKYVFFIPNLLSSLFYRFDISEGYVIIAEKN